MKRIPRLLRKGILLVFLVSLIPNRIQAKTYSDSISRTMGLFFDSIVPIKLKQVHLPGLAVLVTNNDSILFAKGYGYANIQKKVAVDPEKTVWRLASIAKTVTATAVMQLVEQGKLDLNKDVNTYLKNMKVPEKFGKPVTLRNLLTHTAGFDDKYIGKSFRTKKELPPLRDFVKRMLPPRIYPPGKIYNYSNMGIALAALVVQNVSGEDFSEYCRQHIFLPLGMDRTSFRLDKKLEENLYQGYINQGGNFKAVPFDYLGDYPAGQLLTTVDEFSRFMRCQLNDGELNGVRILKTKTDSMMQSPQFEEDPRLIGSVGFVYDIFNVDGNKVVAHNGGYLGVATRMWLFPGRKTGIFMATNIMNMSVINNISYAFVKRFFDNTVPQNIKYPLDSLPVYDPNVAKYTGYYRHTRFPHGDMDKLGALVGYAGEVHIWKNDKGMLMMNNLFGQPRRLIQVQPGVFRSIDDNYYIKFKLSKTGKAEFLFTTGTSVFEKVPEFYSKKVQLTLLGSLLGFFIIILLFRLIYTIVPMKYKHRNPLPEHSRKIRNTSTWTAGLFMLHWLGLGLVLFVLHPSYELFSTGLSYGVGFGMYVAQSVLLIAILPLFFTVVHYFKILGRKEASLRSKMFYAVFILASFLYLWLLNYWNILGFRF